MDTPTDLRLIAQLIDHPVDDLVKLNPSLQRWTTPGNDPGFVLNLPAGTKDLYEQSIASIPPDKRIWWRAHKVVEGETLAGIAKQFRISPVSPGASQSTYRRALLWSRARTWWFPWRRAMKHPWCGFENRFPTGSSTTACARETPWILSPIAMT